MAYQIILKLARKSYQGFTRQSNRRKRVVEADKRVRNSHCLYWQESHSIPNYTTIIYMHRTYLRLVQASNCCVRLCDPYEPWLVHWPRSPAVLDPPHPTTCLLQHSPALPNVWWLRSLPLSYELPLSDNDYVGLPSTNIEEYH